MAVSSSEVEESLLIFIPSFACPGGASGGRLPYIKGGDARREISNEPLKGTNLGVA